MIKLSDYIANFLIENGIKHIFTIPGGGAMHLNNSFGNNKDIKCIYNHHEQACAIAAESYARLTGKLPLVCVTSGPGGTNTLTGVMGAYVDSIPMFIISGQVKIETTIYSTDLPLRQIGDQEFDISTTVKNMTKYSKIVLNKNKIAYYLEKALYIATTGRKGPVWLDIPLDIQGAMIETDNLEHFDSKVENTHKLDISDDTINLVYEKILKSKRPVILAGSAIRLSNSHNNFLKLVNKLQIPVVTAWNAHDVIEDENPYYCGRPGTIGTRGGNFIVENSDLLISLGCRMNIRQISYNYKDFAKEAYKIAIDIDEAELKKPTLKIDLPINANLADFINLMLNKNTEYYQPIDIHKKWLEKCKIINNKYPAVLDKYYKNEKLNPYVFIHKLFTNLEENQIIISANGSACVITFQAAIIKKGQRLFTNSGCATMGYGLPASIGTSIASNQRIICIEGDGSIMMNLQELQTVYHNNLNIKIFILNNNGYHSMRQTQANLFNSKFCGVDKNSGISFPNFKKIAYAFDIEYYKIEKLEEIDNTIKKAFEKDLPSIIEVFVDEKQFFEPKLSSKVHEDGTITSPSLDDMFPFLDKEEYESVISFLKGN